MIHDTKIDNDDIKVDNDDTHVDHDDTKVDGDDTHFEIPDSICRVSEETGAHGNFYAFFLHSLL